MQWFTLLLLAVGLSMDAFAVSVTNGMCYQGLAKKHMLTMAGTFGGFQALMPILGFFLGQTFRQAIVHFDHWVAFGLLFVIGAHMIVEAIREMRHPVRECETQVCSYKKILIQGVATSIDALAVGVSLAMIPDTSIFLSALFIGVVTFLCCLVGVRIGKSAGRFLQGRAEIVGGLILIGIGIKILVEHLLQA